MSDQLNPPAGDAATAFAALSLDGRLAAKLAEAGMTGPTPVQAEAIPPLAAGRDAVLRSPTGTGKTLAYLLPLLQRIDADRRETQAVVMAPTQELAMQIVRVAETYGEPLGVQTVALIGGAALSRQLERMKRRPQLVVGTPGRVREVASLKKLPLHTVRAVVVDETDRVFALGGRGDVEAILRGAARERQTVFVSATRSETMREAEARWLRDPWESETADDESASGLPQTIDHGYMVCDKRDKVDLVRRLARNLKPSGALVFVNDIERIGELLAKLRFEGFAVDALYGDTPGRERGEVLRRFREGRTKLLIATDVAARGLDIPGLPLVVQFEPALDADHYVHRAGRTGRMGRSGRSLSLVTPQERFIMDKLAKRLGIEITERRLAEGRLVAAGSRAAGGRDDGARGAGQRGADDRGGRSARAAAGEAPRSAKPAAGSAGRGTAGAAASRLGAAGQPGGRTARAATGDAAKTAPGAKAKAKADRKRDSKNKGAPRWLKEKRSQSDQPPAP